MSTIYMDVDAALAEVPVNAVPLTDDTDFKTVEEAVAYNAAGLELIWHFVTTGGATTTTVVTPTTGGDYDWAHQDGGMYTIEIPASGGASINNDTEGFGYFTGKATGVLPWRGPTICFRAAGLNNLLVDDSFSATRGLAGTALPNAAADAAGGLPISDAGGLDLDGVLSGNTPQTGDAYARLGAPVGASISADIAGVPAATEAAILDEGDATALLAAIAAKVEEFLINDGDASATLAAIATAVWGAGSRTLSTSPPTASEIADAVYDESLSGHTTAGTAGKALSDLLTSTGTTIPGLIGDLNDLDAAGVRTAIGLASANLDTQLGDLPTAAENAAGLLDLTDGVESSYTVRGLLRILLAVIAGNSTGSGTTYQNPAGTKNRVVSSLDGDNNRTVSSRDVS